ncbi:hypothetical protein IJ103_04185 [Candidatus Saccharibacteria bacterium]|nr:hypothetical protein [Candidatus Saccharibacteria bacterium]
MSSHRLYRKIGELPDSDVELIRAGFRRLFY